MNSVNVSFDSLSLNATTDKLSITNAKLIPISTLPPKVQHFFNVTPYTMLIEGGIEIDEHKEE